MDSIKQYWLTWLWRDAETKLVTINFIVWAICAIASLFGFNLMGFLAIPYGFSHFLACPWTMFTYMFGHYDFMHLLVNMLWLMLFGRLFMQLQGGARLVTLYVYGGIAGAIAFLLLNTHAVMIGSSCSVFAIVGAVAVLYPQIHVNLLLLGEIKVIWIALVAVVLFIIMAGTFELTVAHSAGLVIGIAYGFLRKRGVDITSPFVKMAVKNRTRRMSARVRNIGESIRDNEAELDRLLSKISKSGYQSLSAAERQRLFDLSKNINR